MYSDGQAISTRLCKQITTTTSLLRKSINRFNQLACDPFEGSSYMLPQQLAWEEAADLDTLRTWEIVSRCPHSFSLPAKTVRQLIDDLNLKTRAVEEIQLLKKDMTAVVDHYSDEHKSLQQQLVIHVSQEADSLYAQGCIILLKYRLLSCELMLSQAEAKFSPYVTLPKLPDFSILCDSSEIPLPRKFDTYSITEHSEEAEPGDNSSDGLPTADDTSDDSDIPESDEDIADLSTLVNGAETDEVITASYQLKSPEPNAKEVRLSDVHEGTPEPNLKLIPTPAVVPSKGGRKGDNSCSGSREIPHNVNSIQDCDESGDEGMIIV